MVDQHSLESRRNLSFKKNDGLRLRVFCKGVVLGVNVIWPCVIGGSSGNHNKFKGKEVITKSLTWQLYASRSKKWRLVCENLQSQPHLFEVYVNLYNHFLIK